MNAVERVSIIIPTGGRLPTLTKTLESIEEHAPGNEVIVIGNQSDDLTRESMRRSFPTVKYLECDESSAVVKRNKGIASASNKILVFVDDDVVVEDVWLPNLVRHYHDNSIGGVGGRVKVPGLAVGSSLYKTGMIEDGFVIGNWNPPIDQTIEVEHLIGCNMSLRKGLVVMIGGFDNFFRSCNFREETDLCLRIRKLGYRIVFDPKASLFHMALGRKSQGSRWVYYYVRNTLFLYMKYEPKQGSSILTFFRRLLFPPREYAALTGARVRVTPVTLVVATSGILAGLLGYISHR